MKNLTQVDVESEFASQIQLLFKNNKIDTIIETGTFQGNGTTRIVIESMIKYNPTAKFYSIEVNNNFFVSSTNNIRQMRYDKYVTLLNGLSIPKNKLMTKEQIDEWVDKYKNENIYIDHNPHERTQLYLNETTSNGEDDLLGKYLKNNKVDLLLLDSAGHMGYIEFLYTLELLKNSCYFVLDDVYHLKHFESVNYMKNNPDKFEIITLSHEKFGFCVAKYTYKP